MRGRTIYFQGRRILVFCGEKKNKPHSTNDRFGNANAEIPVGENTETKNTASEFGESDDAAELGNNDDSIVTTTNARPQVDDSAEIGQKINANPTSTILGKNKSGAEINQRINGNALIMRLGKVNSDISIGENADTLKTANPLFTEAVEDIATGEKADTIKTENPVFGEGNETSAAGEAVEGFTDNSAFCEADESIDFKQSVEGYVEKPVVKGDFISFSSAEPFSVKTNNSTKTWNGTLEYSIDAETWVTWDGTSAIGNNKRLYIRGRNNNKITNGVKWVATATAGIKVQGVLETLLDYVSVANGNIPSANGYCFDRLFSGWDKLTDAGDLIILTLNVQYYCRLLFSSCSSLTKAPVILGTNVAQSACEGMFKNDTSLELPPQITITSINVGGFMQAFLGCTSLLYPIKMAGVSTMPTNACFEMYRGCTSLSKIPAFTATSYADALMSMFYECPQIKMSETQTDEYQHAYRMPMSGNGTASVSNPFAGMFAYTGGSFTGTPTINTTYYTANEIIS